MADDVSWVADAMTQAVPWVGTAGITFGSITTDRVEAFLPDRSDQHNHVGGPHAAVMFGLGETASGAVGLAAFASAGDRAVPLVVRSEIRYLKLAKGDLRAEAVLTRPAGEAAGAHGDTNDELNQGDSVRLVPAQTSSLLVTLLNRLTPQPSRHR